MTVTYGFYNSVDGDRVYDALDVGRMFDGLITDGVFELIDDTLVVSAAGGMVVNVGTGKAWFDHTWTINDAALPLTVATADPALGRIDAVVLEVNASFGVRANTFKMVAGTPAGSPTEPTMVHAGGVDQYPLAYIVVGAGVSSIVSGNITNLVGTYLCPFVTVPQASGNGAAVLEVEVFS